jgi:phosphoenolpyruvate carboxylase
MHSLLTEIKSELGKPYADLEFLLSCLSEVLMENNEVELAQQIPWLSEKMPELNAQNQEKLLHLYSIVFQILNMVEVNGAVQNRRHKQEEAGAEGIKGLWSAALFDLKEKGVSEEQLVNAFKQVHVEPVLTAHPTQAKRPIVLALYRELYLQLVKRENSIYTSIEQKEIQHDINKYCINCGLSTKFLLKNRQ